MKPLICFYKDNLFLHATNYERLECPAALSVVDFLKDTEKKFFSEMKVVQINFEADHQNIFENQIELYPAAKASVFILKTYDLISSENTFSECPLSEPISFKPLVQKPEFIEKNKYILSQIQKGRIYQANLTAPLKTQTQDSSETLFHFYQSAFTGKYKAFLPLSEVDVLCFSPELFLQQENKTLITRPIKGSLDQTQNFSKGLIHNSKEEAELSMIVDLLRNDLNSISDHYRSQVTAHRENMQLGYIQHTYSEIQVRSTSSLSQVIEKTFPGGSISGCPKLESLQIIREVENHKRQIYTGSIGWWKQNDFCLNIAIRTLIHYQDQLFYHAGCGIVFDSNPESEWQEFLLKTGALHVK